MNRRTFLKSLSLLTLPYLGVLGSQKSKIDFKHGVASGDPTNTHIILWTRVTPSKPSIGQLNVEYQVSKDVNFTNIVSIGTLKADIDRDFTVKVDVDLSKHQPGTNFFYRFKCEDSLSPVGQTKTLPQKNLKHFKIAVFSCSNYPAGYFNAYKDAAKDKSIDLVLHLGDYLYEYKMGDYGTENAENLSRVPIPFSELKSLSDYRIRHAQYKSDLDAQLLHASFPMIPIWDDHEVANNSYKTGAQNHQENEGFFLSRKRNALKAYFEWMPVRDIERFGSFYKNFKIGDLVNLQVLESRLSSREKQISYDDFIDKDAGLNKEKFLKELNKERELIGQNQLDKVRKNTSNKYTWNVIAQQVLLSKLKLPDLPEIILENIPAGYEYFRTIIKDDLPYNLDSWDGYPNERRKLLSYLKNKGQILFLAGDSHNCWAGNIKDDQDHFIGVEFGAPSVTSPGTSEATGELFPIKILENMVVNKNDDLVWTNLLNRGYVTIDFTREIAKTRFIGLSQVKTKNYSREVLKEFIVEKNKEII